MKPEKLQYFKKLILEKRQEILEDDDSYESDKVENNSEEDKYATHMADLGSNTMEKEQSSYLEARVKKYLTHLDNALERIEKGTYGICLECGNKISVERLEAVPHTRYCVPCKRQMDN